MSQAIEEKVISIIEESQKLAPGTVTADKTFEELGIDSLDGISIVFALETEFNVNIPDEDAQEMKSVRQVVERLSAVIDRAATKS